jgi:hypothetical protein
VLPVKFCVVNGAVASRFHMPVEPWAPTRIRRGPVAQHVLRVFAVKLVSVFHEFRLTYVVLLCRVCMGRDRQ